MRIRHYLTTMLAAVGLTVAAALTVAAPAQAAYGCSGSLLEAQPIVNDSGTRIGEIQVYWDSSRGRNCASTVHGGSTWGVNLFTLVEVFVCPTSQTSSCLQGYDVRTRLGDWVSYYVWENSVSSSGRCVYARGWIGSYYTTTKPGHCA